MKHGKSDVRRGFTLVELLVVIGIIALLISILLPSLNQARRSARSVMCLSNLRQIGVGFAFYANDNKGMIVPTGMWKNGVFDMWPFILINANYLPNPHIRDGGPTDPTNAYTSIFVCPSAPQSAANGLDGFSRYESNFILPDSEPIDNGASGRAIVYLGYGTNGANAVTGSGGTPAQRQRYLPMQGQPLTAADNATANGGLGCMQIQKYTNFHDPSKTVLLHDGTLFNNWTFHTRISGTRHGRNLGGSQRYTTGTTNILFLDGHVAGAPRKDLPNSTTSTTASQNQIIGTTSQMLNDDYIWNEVQLQ